MTNSPHNSSVSFATAQAQARSRDQTQIMKVLMPDMTFPAEYTRDVDYLANRANDHCDSMMTLLTAYPSQRLVISLTRVQMLDGEESILIMHKKRRILPFVPIEDGTRRVKQMASLATALSSSKTEFNNDLTYMTDMAPRSSNLARLGVCGMQRAKKP